MKQTRSVTLKPFDSIDVSTGIHVPLSDVCSSYANLSDFVVKWESEQIESIDDIIKRMSSLRRIPKNPAETARQIGLDIDYSHLPREVKAKSRVNKLAGASLISDVVSYEKLRRKQGNAQKPTPSNRLILGAVDRQMCSLAVEDNRLTLLWKCWDKEYLLSFNLPTYVAAYLNVKWCLPTVRWEKRRGLVFDFAYGIDVDINKPNTLKSGVDLGVVVPYTAVVINSRGRNVAIYTTSPHLRRQYEKVGRRKKEVVETREKIVKYENLGIDTTILKTQVRRLRSKNKAAKTALSSQSASELSRKLEKHHLHEVNVENLKWVVGPKFGSKWDYSQQQDHIENALLKKGVSVKKVNPRNTSQTCHGCGSPVVHNTKRRTVRCRRCQTEKDRDFNAAMNIAAGGWNSYRRPDIKTRGVGNDCSPKRQVIHAGKYGGSVSQGQTTFET